MCQHCEKGIFRKPPSPGPPSDAIIIRLRAVPPVGHFLTSSVRPSAPEASLNTTGGSKHHVRLTPKGATMKMQANIKLGPFKNVDDSYGTAYNGPL